MPAAATVAELRAAVPVEAKLPAAEEVVAVVAEAAEAEDAVVAGPPSRSPAPTR